MASVTDENVYSETVNIARDLIRFDTSNRGGGDANPELEAAEYVADFLSSIGVDSKIYESEPGRATVIAKIKGKDPSLPAIIFHGHLDVVPAENSEWSVHPFAGIIKDGLLWGRGAVDMKNMNAMILTSVAEILRSGNLPNRDLILAFFADEEAGGVYGSQFIVREHPEVFAGAKYAISEVGGYSVYFGDTRSYLLQTGEKALDWLILEAEGRAAHGSTLPESNSLVTLARAIEKLGSYEWPLALCRTTENLLAGIRIITGESEMSAKELVALAGVGSAFLKSSITTTTNPTMLSAGYKHNVIPKTARAAVDVRSLQGERDSVIEQIHKIVGPNIKISYEHSDIGLEVPFSGELVDAMRTSLLKEDPDAQILPYLLSGGTDNKSLSKLGIIGYGFAPLKLPKDLDFAGMFHGVDERVPLDALDFGHRVLKDLMINF